MKDPIKREEKHSHGWLITIVCFILFFVALYFLFNSGGSQQEQITATQQQPTATYDVLVKIVPGTTDVSLRCMPLDYGDAMISGNYSFFWVADKDIGYYSTIQGDLKVQHRIEWFHLQNNYPFTESDLFKKVASNVSFKDGFRCRGMMLSSDNGWKYEVYDNGDKEVNSLNLWDNIEIQCMSAPDRRENFTCTNYYNNAMSDNFYVAQDVMHRIGEEVAK